jgi:hypothetical protein
MSRACRCARGAAHLGAQGTDPDPAPPGSLEAGLHGRDLLLPADGSRARLCFHTQPGSYNDLTLIVVLKQLHRFLRGAPVTLIWDNLPSHHRRVMGAWLAGQGHWLTVEYLPGYAHDLDPVEGLWPT